MSARLERAGTILRDLSKLGCHSNIVISDYDSDVQDSGCVIETIGAVDSLKASDDDSYLDIQSESEGDYDSDKDRPFVIGASLASHDHHYHNYHRTTSDSEINLRMDSKECEIVQLAVEILSFLPRRFNLKSDTQRVSVSTDSYNAVLLQVCIFFYFI